MRFVHSAPHLKIPVGASILYRDAFVVRPKSKLSIIALLRQADLLPKSFQSRIAAKQSQFREAEKENRCGTK
jgi:hypothetical protein